MSNELYHYGIKGQQWGRRLYQNKDGSLTPAGKIRYGSDEKSRHVSTGTYQNTFTNTTNRLEFTKRTGNEDQDRFDMSPKNTAYENRFTVKNLALNTGTVGRHPTMNVSEDTAAKLLDSSYDDLSDDELDTLYELTRDDKVLKYRQKRTAKIVAAGKKYAEGSKLSNWIESTLASAVNSVNALVSKGKNAVEKWNKRKSIATSDIPIFFG